MLHLIDELKAIPGVVGACIVNSQDGVQATNLPSIFKVERLTLIGQRLLKFSAVGRMSFDDLTDITLNYDESVVVARELGRNTLLFAICEPTFNQNLLAMSFNLLHEEFKLGNFTQEAAKVEPPVEAPAAAPTPAPEKTSAALQELLDGMKDALGKILGPMAGFVFDEVAETWAEQGAQDSSRIEELIEQINQEIDDPEKIKKYRQLISPVIEDFKKG